MTNKEQLRDVNNPRLREIKTTAVNLPTQESMKQGLHVWKKSEPGLNITGTLSGGTATRDVYRLNVDASFTKSDLIGSYLYGTGNDAVGYFNEEGWFISGNVKIGYSYNPSTKELGISMPIGAETITIKKDAVFIGYVVSDDPNAYPDGGTKDGYWYEKVKQYPVNMDNGRVYPVSGRITIAHSLGEKPTGFCVMDASTINNKLESNTGMIFYPNLYYGDATLGRYFYSSSSGTYNYSTSANEKTITFPQTFVNGREYVWFAFV